MEFDMMIWCKFTVSTTSADNILAIYLEKMSA